MGGASATPVPTGGKTFPISMPLLAGTLKQECNANAHDPLNA